ncbi:putative Chemotaxis protein CheW [Azospirillaceae bacterium]
MDYWSKIDCAARGSSGKQIFSYSHARKGGKRTESVAENYLVCGVGEEIYAFDVIQVREVLNISLFHRLPNMPDFMRGMINVSGKAVSVIDLRVKFGALAADITEKSRIVLVDVVVGRRSTVVGILCDQVYEVISLEFCEIAPPPDIGVSWRSDIIRGLGRWRECFVIVVNLNKLLSCLGKPVISRVSSV